MKNKWIKGIVGLVVCLLLSGILAACGASSNPAQVVSSYLTALKKQDRETMALYSVDDTASDSYSDGMTETPELMEKILDFDYKILTVDEQGQTASVVVQFTTYDFQKYFSTALQEAFSNAMQGAFISAFGGEAIGEEYGEQAVYDAFNNNMNLLEEKTFVYEAEIPLEKTEKGWVITDTNRVLNGILGGAGDYLDNVTEGLEDSFGLDDQGSSQSNTSGGDSYSDLVNSLPIGQKNAVKSAESYLKSMAFSRDGLFQQLTSEYGSGYTEEEASAAIAFIEEHGRVDWNAEAAESAESYIKSMAFSRNGLYQQLTSEYGEQFTDEQASYGIAYLEDNGKVDRFQEAAESAESYLKYSSFSRDELYNQLTSEYGEGFTAEHAEYALTQVGY